MTSQITLSGSSNEKHIEWKISDFFRRHEYFINSPPFNIFNANFHLQLKPKYLGCVCMYIYNLSSFKFSAEYIMGIKSADGTEVKGKKLAFLLLERSGTPSFTLISVNDLFKSKDTMAPGDCLTVFCNIRLEMISSDLNISYSYTKPSLCDFKVVKTKDVSSPNTSLHERKDIKGVKDKDFLLSIISLYKGKDIKGVKTKDVLLPNTSLDERKDIKELKDKDFLSSNTSLCEGKDIAVSGDSEVNEAISVLIENLKDLYLKKSSADITIKVKNKEFHAHKLILVARSNYFAAMFEHDSLEERSSIVKITDCDPDSFEDFLLFLYTADLKIVSSKNVVGLYKTSDKYGCKELVKECVRCMIRDMSLDTFCDYFQLATMHNESDLLKATTNYFTKNAKTLFLTTKWITLLEEQPSLCNELLIKLTSTG